MQDSFSCNIFLRIYTKNDTFILANLESSADRSYLPGYGNFRAFQGIQLVPVLFPVAVIKSFTKAIEEEAICLAHSSALLFIIAERPRWQGLEAAAHSQSRAERE